MPCRPGIKNLLFLQASSWNFPTGLTTGLGSTVFCVCASGSVLNISVFVPCSSGAEEKAVFCVSPVPWELCRTVRCVNHVLQIPGTNRVCVYCASGFWWDIPVFSRCRRPATPPARSVRYRVCLCIPSSFCVYKPCNLSLGLRTDLSLSLSLFPYSIVLLLLFFFSVVD